MIRPTAYLEKITDDFGVWQHTKKGKILRSEGYALDDSARALIVFLLYNKKKFAQICLQYLENSLVGNNLVGFFNQERKSVAFPASYDAFALALWALGFAVEKNFEVKRCTQLLSSLDPNYTSQDVHIRPRAYSLAAYSHLGDKKLAEISLKYLVDNYASRSNKWFEDYLFYANAAIPYSILLYLLKFNISHKKYDTILLESINTLEREMRIGKIPAPIGNRKRHEISGNANNHFGQQPIDAAFMVLMLTLAFKYFKNSEYLREAKDWMDWFYGNNICHTSLVTPENACADGIDENCISQNFGAESTIMYLWARHEYETITKIS